MNKILSLLGAILVMTSLHAQVQGNITGKYYETNVDLKVLRYNILHETVDSSQAFIAKSRTKFTAYETIGDKILIKFWRFSNDSINKKSKNEHVSLSNSYTSPPPNWTKYDTTIDNNVLVGSSMNQHAPHSKTSHLANKEVPKKYKDFYISYATNGEYFLMDIKDFNNKTSEFFGESHSFAWGFSTLPIKLRFGGKNKNFDYGTGFSLGINAGYEYQIKSRTRQSIGLLLGAGISTVQVTPETTNNSINKSTTTGAFVPTISIIYSYTNFQIGTFVGIDYIPGEIGKNWAYKNSPWLGLGLGFTIFQKNKSDISSKQQQVER